MSEIAKPHAASRSEEEEFLSPSGQPDSLVDRLAVGQAAFVESSEHPTVTWVVDLAPGSAVIILRGRR